MHAKDTKEMVLEALQSLHDNTIKNSSITYFTIQEIAEEIGRSDYLVRKWAHILESEGLIELIQKRPHCAYFLKIKGTKQKGEAF